MIKLELSRLWRHTRRKKCNYLRHFTKANDPWKAYAFSSDRSPYPYKKAFATDFPLTANDMLTTERENVKSCFGLLDLPPSLSIRELYPLEKCCKFSTNYFKPHATRCTRQHGLSMHFWCIPPPSKMWPGPLSRFRGRIISRKAFPDSIFPTRFLQWKKERWLMLSLSRVPFPPLLT